MKTWGEFAVAAPALAARGRELLYRSGEGVALLVTVSGTEPPQVHPITVGIVEDGLYAFMLPSPKLRDLLEDGRYALHAVFDPARPHEFLLRGRVRQVEEARRSVLAPDWPWSVGSAPAFEFLIGEALFGERASPDDWPPRYTAWSSPQTSPDALDGDEAP